MQKLEGDFSREIRIIPWWAYLLGLLGFACMQFVFNVVILREPNPPPAAARVFLGLLVGFILMFYFLLVGYVNRDAGRRGMSRGLWTLIAIFVPNGIGFLLYFLMRKPLQLPCPHCGATMEPGFAYCSKCGKALKPTCPHCGVALHTADAFCPACGKSVTPSA